jgi:hypothetical protein
MLSVNSAAFRPLPVTKLHGGIQIVGQVGGLRVGGVEPLAKDIFFARGVVVNEGGSAGR